MENALQSEKINCKKVIIKNEKNKQLFVGGFCLLVVLTHILENQLNPTVHTRFMSCSANNSAGKQNEQLRHPRCLSTPTEEDYWNGQ